MRNIAAGLAFIGVCSAGLSASIVAVEVTHAAPARAAVVKPGAAVLGTTNYPVPVGALFVAATGDDAAAGTQSSPWRTIRRAVAGAVSGTTIVLRGGIYRESVDIANKAITLQPFPNEAAILRGSKIVSNWTANTAATWVSHGWNYQFPRQLPILVTAAHPLANAPDMVFYDGKAMRQVGSLKGLSGKSFYVDYATANLYLGADPTGHALEASYLSTGLTLNNADNSVIRGLQFDEYATPVNTHGAVVDLSDHVSYENDWFVNNAMAGLSLMGTNTFVDRSTAATNGQLGIHGFQATGVTVTNSRFKSNNAEGFSQTVESGGAKFSSVSNVVFANNLFDLNHGTGLWFDLASSSVTVVRNEFLQNTAHGMVLELSAGAILASNLSRSNAGTGIRINESTDADIYNNVLYKNDVALDVIEGPRPQTVANINIKNNVMMDGHAITTALLDVEDYTRVNSGSDLGVAPDFNAYCRTVANTPSRVAAWARANAGPAFYSSVAAFAAGTGGEANGFACEGTVAKGMFTHPTLGQFKLGAASIGHGAGAPLPNNVATALGLTSGGPVDLGLI